jgi:pyruvate dehydrogenase E1 component alpha subunit
MINMKEKNVYEGEVKFKRILDEKGKAKGKVSIDDNLLKKMYEMMVLTRTYDEKAIKLQRQGRMGTYAPVRGQEAVGTGAIHAIMDKDWVLPTYREPQPYFGKGVPLSKLYLYWMGSEEGMNLPEDSNAFPFVIPIATHLPHAGGIALSLKRSGEEQVLLAFVGDGGTSEGDFHEGLNFAGVWNLPLVVVIVNNGWAISVPRSKQSASDTLAQKGLAYGIPSVQVDGNDVLAVYEVVSKAVEEARKGKGPRLIEALTYRMEMHTTSDDPTRYREEEEVSKWQKLDPIDRMRKYLKSKKIWDKDYEEKIKSDFKEKVSEAVKEAESIEADPKDMFRYVWAEMTDDLGEQMEEMEALEGGDGE